MTLTAFKNRLRKTIRRWFIRRGFLLQRLNSQEQTYMLSAYDASSAGDPNLHADPERLGQLRKAYKALDWPSSLPSSWWQDSRVQTEIPLHSFRGDSPFIWHYRELPKLTRIKYFLFSRYVQELDNLALFSKVDEDGAFGCWTFEFEGVGRVSRDLLDSINELNYLERQLSISQRNELRILDIGAGYGRLAYRATTALPKLKQYACVDAIPESTYLCDFYIRHRKLMPTVEIVEFPDVRNYIGANQFDLAVNIHSFSECTAAAIDWWVKLIATAKVPYLFVVPNEAEGFLTREADGSRQDFAPIIDSAGYSLINEEYCIQDPAIRELLDIHDRFCLFKLR